MPDPTRLDELKTLRENANINQATAAVYCGLSGRRGRLSLAAWENGDSIPQAKRRARFIPYLWDHLRLRGDPQKFLRIWEILVEEWEWEPISDGEWQRLTSAPRPAPPSAPPTQLVPASRAPFQAPALTPHFVGREAEFTQLETILTDSAGPRIVALVGMGGIGKTTLAVGLAHRLRARFQDGVLWASVAISHPLDILQSWAQAYGRDFSTLVDVETRAAVMRDLLTHKHVLVVLDDVRTPETVRPLIPSSATSQVLFTTRDHDLAAALNAFPSKLEEMNVVDSKQLLVALLGEARVAAEDRSATAICELLQHYPLALEIVAKLLGRAKWQRLQEILDHLRDAKQRLDRLHFKDLSVRISFDVSWAILQEELRTVFTYLSLWEGRSFALPAISHLLQQPDRETAEHLLTLVSLSLLKVGDDGRFWQHPLLADFGRERLSQPEPLVVRQAAYYLALFEGGQDKAQLELEYHNALLALQTLQERQVHSLVVRFALALTPTWLRLARYSDARRGLDWGLAAAKQVEEPVACARLQIDWGYICAEQGDSVEAEEHEQAGILFAQFAKNEALVSDAQLHLASLAIDRAEYEQADQLLTDCIAIRQKNGDVIGVARALQSRAKMLSRNGLYDDSNQLAKEILTQQESLSDVPGMFATLRLLVENKLAERQNQEAADYNNRFMSLALQHDFQAEVAEAYFCAANVSRRLKNIPQARAYAKDAYQRFERMGNRLFLASVLYEQSTIEYIDNFAQQAKLLGESALQLMESLKDDFNCVYCYLHLGDVETKLGHHDLARLRWQQGLELGVAIRHPAVKFLRSRLGIEN